MAAKFADMIIVEGNFVSDGNKTKNPYVAFEFNGDHHQTITKKDTQNQAVWNQRFRLPL